MSTLGDPVVALARMLRTHLGDVLRPAESFIDMFDTDGVMEFPYAPADGVHRLQGRDEMQSYFDRIAGMLSIAALTDVEVHIDREGGTAVLEFGCDGAVLPSGRPYRQRYISAITLRDGRITRYRDYWNPQVVTEALESVTS